MHFVISATYGPTDPTRAMLPFIFAASAVQSGDQVTLMLFADSVLMAVEGCGASSCRSGRPIGARRSRAMTMSRSWHASLVWRHGDWMPLLLTGASSSLA